MITQGYLARHSQGRSGMADPALLDVAQDYALKLLSDVRWFTLNRRHPGGVNVAMRENDATVLAVSHLREVGHKRLAHLAGPERIDTADRRVAGYKARSATPVGP